MKHFMNGLARLGVITALVVGFTACDTADILEVLDPDLVTPDNVQGEKGAELFWAGALGRFSEGYSGGGGGMVMYTGMFTDEFHLSGTFPTRNEVDRRNIDEQNGTMDGVYTELHQARTGLENATVVMEEFLPGDPRIAEMYNLAGFTYVMFGENYCAGVPYGQAPSSGELIEGTPTTKEQTLQNALDRFNSGTAAAAGDTDQQYLAAVGVARAQAALGNFAGAATAVASVPTDWQYMVHHKGGGAFDQRNAIFELNQSQRRWSVSDMEGGVGAPFRTAVDPRVVIDADVGIGFDEGTLLYQQLKYPSWDAEVPLATGIDARLIEAEASLAANDAPGWLAALNALRTTLTLPDLVDPGTDSDRWKMHFVEHGFWTFATAQRLGMARRMVLYHGLAEADVMPNGAFFKGGVYGSDVNFIIPFDDNIDTGEGGVRTGCTSVGW